MDNVLLSAAEVGVILEPLARVREERERAARAKGGSSTFSAE